MIPHEDEFLHARDPERSQQPLPCPNCSYDLRGGINDYIVCSECGAGFTRRALLRRQPDLLRRPARRVGYFIATTYVAGIGGAWGLFASRRIAVVLLGMAFISGLCALLLHMRNRRAAD